MLPLTFLGAWVGLWACVRLLFALPALCRCSHKRFDIEKEWWRVTIRVINADRLNTGVAGRRRAWLRRWFSVGAVAGLLAGVCSVVLLCSELWTLLRPAPGQDGAAGRAAGTEDTRPRLQLALPGVTLPASHAPGLWLALAASLAVHEAGHALAAAAEGVAVTGAGVSVLLLVPAAFVELDSADLAGLSRHSMLRVAAAGAWHNLVLCAACWALGGAAGAAARSGAGASWVLGPLLGFVRQVLGYTASLCAALALLNMAPVHFLDGQPFLEALLLRPGRPPEDLPEHEQPGPQADGGPGSKAACGRRAMAVRWCMHTCTALYAAVVVLHLARMR